MWTFATSVTPWTLVISKAARRDDSEKAVPIDPTKPGGSSRSRAAALSTSDIVRRDYVT
jgi:hypothetical protein